MSINPIFFNENLEFGRYRYSCCVDKEGNLTASNEANNKKSTLRNLSEKLDMYDFKLGLGIDVKNKSLIQFKTYQKNIERLNGKIGEWNQRITGSWILSIINIIVTLKIDQIAMKSLNKTIAALEKKEKMEEFIKENSEYIQGDLRRAKIIFLGDTHTDPSQNVLRTTVYDYLQTYFPLAPATPVHILRESYPSYTISPLNEQEKAAKEREEALNHSRRAGMTQIAASVLDKNVHIRGWEDMSLYREGLMLVQNLLRSYAQYDALETEIETLQEKIKTLQGEINKDELVCKEIEKIKEEIFSKMAERQKLESEMNACDTSSLALKRNPAMIASATKASLVAGRVFCIAGSNHYRKDASFLSSKFFEEGEWALVIPKTMPTTKEQDDKFFQGLLNA